jgi:hypothetical protein
MKKIIILCLLAVSVSLTSLACPICGCGGGNLYMGLLPDFKSHFIGLRYHYAQYHTQLISDPSQFADNYYNSVELWGGMRVGKKLQLLAFIPYYFNKQVDDDGTTTPRGLGDVSLIGQYQVFRDISVNGKQDVIDQQLWLGGGIKLPTGPFNADPLDSTTTIADINAQIGTGSVDFLLNGLYTITIGNAGISASANYKINLANKDNYKFGNKFTANLIAFYRVPIGKNSMAPNLGLGYENVAANTIQKEKIQYTGSTVTTILAGVEFNFKRVGLGFNGQVPVAQNFAEGQTRMNFKGMMHITYSI